MSPTIAFVVGETTSPLRRDDADGYAVVIARIVGETTSPYAAMIAMKIGVTVAPNRGHIVLRWRA